MTRFSASEVIADLKDFQRDSVDHAFSRLFLDSDSTRRFLVADETGLGKTMVARGIIARAIERLQDDEAISRIDVVYVCSNADIAEQNLRKLTVVGDHRPRTANRLTMLVAEPDLLDTSGTGDKPVTFVSFTPSTSFDMGWQTGTARERAILYLLLVDHLGLRRGDATALRRLLQGRVTSLRNFQRYIDDVAPPGIAPRWERSIQRRFLRGLDRSPLRTGVTDLVDALRGRAALNQAQRARADELVASLRHLLARSSVKALEPDLVILDEFQRFKGLLARGSEAAELAHHLFDQPDARVLLLSATPYKPFTLSGEREAGEDHYEDLFATLRFLAGDETLIESIKAQLASFRTGALLGHVPADERAALETNLLRLLSRVERPQFGPEDVRTSTAAPDLRAEDVAGFVALHRIAQVVEAPVTVEYWKSAPYFVNFLDGYQVGAKVKAAVHDPLHRHRLHGAIHASQRIERSDVEQWEPIEWGNARLRALAADTVERGLWQLLWMPPSLPYHAPGGPFAEHDGMTVTKRLVFSSWVAAPSAIASLLSYDVERRIRTATGRTDAGVFTPRLQYRIVDERAASMTTLALFWPCPTLAAATDPLDAARTQSGLMPLDALQARTRDRVEPMVGVSAAQVSTTTTAWYAAAAIGLDAPTTMAAELGGVESAVIANALLGAVDEPAETDDAPRAVLLHALEGQRVLDGERPFGERPSDLANTLALLGVAGPGNVAWRALRRVVPADASITLHGLWLAAAVLASGFRSLFNRPDATLLLDTLTPSDDDTYWRSVLGYCRDGNLQAVVDEYLHHLAGAEGIEPTDDEQLLALARAARRALSVRLATYRALDTEHPNSSGIPFRGRFALRYGGIRQEQDDVRLPEVRAAFNSPFWPFVLATTSIGQEGVDLHWWCHSIVHWNLPSNPVDFEQREGRVNRFKGHAIRKNVAAAKRDVALASGERDVWRALFEAAEQDRDSELGDMIPYWAYPGPAATERSVLSLPLSRDEPAWERLKQTLVLYRLAYGQPRQEDMVNLLRRQGITAADVDELRLRLAPPRRIE